MNRVITGLLGLVLATSVHAADLVTRSGKVHHNYRIVSHDAGYVTVLDSEGGGRVPLSDLPDDLQRKYGYDPAQAAAFISGFEAAQRQQGTAPTQTPTASTEGSTPEVVQAANPTLASSSPPASDAFATRAETESPDANFDSGYDPLQPDAQILHNEQENSAPEVSYVGYDSAGAMWLSSIDAEGMTHWYPHHIERAGRDAREDRDALHLDGHRDLPDGAVVTRDRSGRWIITTVDSHGNVNHSYQDAEYLHLDPAVAWNIRVDRDGRRVATRDAEAHQPPNLHYVSFTPNGPEPRFAGSSSNPRHPGYSSPSITPGSVRTTTSSYSSGSTVRSYSTGSTGRSYSGGSTSGYSGGSYSSGSFSGGSSSGAAPAGGMARH
jgi:uncharacterized membrane protein YgcG